MACGASLETLAEYVKRIMDEKGLSSRDVRARSGRRIADSYINKIVNGITTNPSIDKTKALAEGLGVDEDEVFKVARGISITESGRRGGDPWPSNVLVAAMEAIISSPDFTAIVKAVLASKPAKIKAVKKVLDIE
jgi:transcriptional regulator with XRE-family HTH domain